MPRFADTELLEWRQRLEYAHKYWGAKGLTSSSTEPASAARFVEYYRGNQWGQIGWAGLAPEDCITVNVTHSNTNAMMSKLSKRNPDVIVTPTQRTSDFSARARRTELVMRHYMRELKMKRQVDRCLFDALLGPFGLVEHFYMPHIEKYDRDGVEIESYSQARPGLPGIRRRPWWDVRIDPMAESFEPDGTARWCAFRSLLTMEQVRSHPRLTVRDDLAPTKSVDLALGHPRQNNVLGQNPEWSKLVELWWVYDKSDKKFFCLSPGSQKALMEPEDWPIPWEALPYSYLAFTEQVDSNIPLPFPKVYEDQQIELNKNRTIMAELVKRLRRIVLGRRDAFTETDRKRLEAGDLGISEFFFADGSLGDAIAQVQLGNFPQELLLYDVKIQQDIREAMGLSQMDRGQRINVQSAAEANSVQTGSDIQSSRLEETFEDFWADILRRFNQTLRMVMPEQVLVQIVGSADAAALAAEGEYVNVTREDIQGEYSVKIRAGSTLPEDHNQLFAKALQLKAVLKDDPAADQTELTRVLVEEAGFDSKRLGLSPAAVVETQKILEQRGLGGGAQGGKSSKAAPGNTGIDANFLRLMQGGKGPA